MKTAFSRSCFFIGALLCACSGAHLSPVSTAFPGSYQRVDATEQSAITNPADGQSRTQLFKLGDGSTNGWAVSDARLGVDGLLHYALYAAPSPGPVANGEIGAFDLTTHGQTYRTVPYFPGAIEQTADRSIWATECVNGGGTPSVDRYSATTGYDTPIAVAVGPFSPPYNGICGGVAIGADGRFWFAIGNSGPGGNDIGDINATNNSVALYLLPAPSGGKTPWGAAMVLGADKHLWMADSSNDGVFRIVSSGKSTGNNSFFQLPQGPAQAPNTPIASGMAALATNVYAGSLFGTNPGMGAFDVAPARATASFRSITLPSLGVEPTTLAASGSIVYYFDSHFLALGAYNTSTRKMVVLPMAGVTPTFAGTILFVDGAGVPWISCQSGNAACIERINLSSTWAVYPSLSVKVYTSDPYGHALPPGLLGIGETGNSGPFKASSSNTAICKASMIEGFDHNVELDPVAPGKCLITIADAHGRTANVTVTVVKGSGNPQARVRQLRTR